MRILGVHGINSFTGEDPANGSKTLTRRWLKPLTAGLGGTIDLHVPYYAHHLHPSVSQAGAQDPTSLDPEAQQMLLDWTMHLGAQQPIVQGYLAKPVRQAADWIATNYGLDNRAVRTLVTVFCREVHTYFTFPDRRQATCDEISNAIIDYDPRIVIAHSLGSVVAYEVLWQNKAHSIDLLISLGSPLGLPDVVFPRLVPRPSGGRGSRPPGLRGWINIRDPGDFVAVPSRLAELFSGVTADLETPVGAFASHKVTKYLTSSAIMGVLSAYQAMVS